MAVMVYRVLKFLFYFAIKGYFRSISFRNKDRAQTDGPVIFIANHTSAFMDPMVIALHVRRQVWFLARGEAFRNPMINRLLSWFHMIPIFRPEITPEKVFQNEEIFSRCYEHLAEGKCMIIFPEGFSKTERRIRKIKTGTARIALGAETHYDFKLGLKIIPIGLNYSNPHLFQSDLFINFGTPIEVADYKEIFTENSYQAVQKLTDTIRQRLEKCTVVIEDEILDNVVANIEKIYRDQLRQQMEEGKDIQLQNFYLSKEIVNAVRHFYETHKQRLFKVSEMINKYMNQIRQLEIRDVAFRKAGLNSTHAWRFLYLLLGLPLFLYGFLTNILPFKFTEVLSRRFIKREDFRGSIQLAVGMFSFLIFYIVQSLAVMSVFNLWIALAFFVSLYPSSLFALRFFIEYKTLRKRLLFFTLFMNRSDVIARLAAQRQKIIDELEEGKTMYLRILGRQESPDTVM